MDLEREVEHAVLEERRKQAADLWRASQDEVRREEAAAAGCRQHRTISCANYRREGESDGRSTA